MPLPSSIWVKFTNEDAVLVTYLGVEYRLTPQTVDGNPYYYAVISGTLTDGYVLSYAGANDDQDLSGSETTNIRLAQYISGVETDPTTVGTITYSAWSVTSFTGTDISAASIVHRDVRLPLFVELPHAAETQYGSLTASDSLGNPTWQLLLYAETSSESFSVGLGDGESYNAYSLTWNSTTNTGTTDCPFVEFIGELSVLEVFTASGTWIPPENIDTTMPVIVEAWGSGENGGETNGGGGSGYGAKDVGQALVSAHAVLVPTADYAGLFDNNDIGTGNFLLCVGFGGENESGSGGVGYGEVNFTGGSAVATAGGGSAYPYQNAVESTGYGAGGADEGVAGSIPGGGGGAMAAGARGEVRIHYSPESINSQDVLPVFVVATFSDAVSPRPGDEVTVRVGYESGEVDDVVDVAISVYDAPDPIELTDQVILTEAGSNHFDFTFTVPSDATPSLTTDPASTITFTFAANPTVPSTAEFRVRSVYEKGATVISCPAIPGAVSYRIYRGTELLQTILAADVSPEGPSFSDDSLTLGTYSFSITAVDSAGGVLYRQSSSIEIPNTDTLYQLYLVSSNYGLQ